MSARDSTPPNSDATDPFLAFGPVAIVFTIAVVGVCAAVALSGDSAYLRLGALVCLMGTLAVGVIALLLHRRLRESNARRLAEADETILRSDQFAATQVSIVSMISHELRTPLQAITTNAEYLENAAPLTSDAADALARLQRAATLIDGRLRNLAQYARATSDAAPRSDAFALRELLLRIVDDYRAQAELRHQQLRMEFAPGTETAIQGDPIRVNQIVANYVANAIHNSVPSDTIIIRTSFSPVVAAPQRMLTPTVEIEVVDHGPGISADVRESLWAPFVTTKKQTPTAANSGLGLAVVKLIADFARWEVGARPTPGGGTTFYVRLPVKPGRPR
jgi:two-component system, OmpR family, sensor kinase